MGLVRGMVRSARAQRRNILLMLALATGSCFPLGDNEGPKGATQAQVAAALSSCRVPKQYLMSSGGELTVKFPDKAQNTEPQRHCVEAYLQKLGVFVSMAWRERIARRPSE